jgi:peptidylprolyl isomerase
MVEGEKARFWIPGKLAYGEKPSDPSAPAGTLVFDVQLLAIKR